MRRLQMTTLAVLLTLVARFAPERARADNVRASASSEQEGSPAAGAVDADRFALDDRHAWRGKAGEESWWWQCAWSEPREVGAILQIVGDDSLAFRNAPKRSVWQASLDGKTWTDLEETAVADERRIYRLHRLSSPRQIKFLRMKIESAQGEFPTLREVQVFADPKTDVEFPEWIVAVSTIDRAEWQKNMPEGRQFVPLARSCPGWEHLQAQFVWLDSFDEAFVSVEPQPLCAFLSGNFSDFCQKERTVWRGTQEVLEKGRLPIWASCGGAQGLAILAEVGAERPWDCPHCRDPKNPKSPIYGHIGHTSAGPHNCGDYSACLFERGKQSVLAKADDPVFEGLAREFEVMESHCGQIEYAPKGWMQIAGRGNVGRTEFQCLRVKDRYIYAAQFHIEMAGTPETSRRIMSNFLTLAKAWGGYNLAAKPVPAPVPYERRQEQQK